MNRKITSAAIGTGVLGASLVGATFVGSAGAYGGLDDAPADGVETETQALAETGDNVQIQDDTDAPEAEGTEEEGEERSRRGRRGGCNLEAVAEAIGIEVDALRTELDNGQSIADVAEANGVDSTVVVDAIVDAAEERIQDKVDAGRITQEEADEKLAGLEDRAEERVERVRGEDGDAEA